ncbi:MAG: hypothetical protein CL801_07045 [Citromicrobium sp.]|nr:hypothetical protein [Citromicrobium sp.]
MTRRTTTTPRAFERTSKRRKGYPSGVEDGQRPIRVKRGQRTIKGGQIELLEKLGRNDPCPCGSGKRFQTLLPAHGPLRRRRAAGLLAVSRGIEGETQRCVDLPKEFHEQIQKIRPLTRKKEIQSGYPRRRCQALSSLLGKFLGEHSEIARC